MPEVLRPAVFNPAQLGTMPMSYPQDAVGLPAQDHALISPIPDDEGTIPRYYFSPRYSTVSTDQYISYSPGSEDFPTPRAQQDFPTPKAGLFNMSSQPSPRFPKQQEHAGNDYDSLYDITDDEAEVPLKCSNSVKKVAGRNRYPSLIIPSPSTWPTIEKLQSAISARPPTSAALETPRHAYKMFSSHNLQVPNSAAPSLDGSLTSEEMDKLSCPSTPDLQKRPESPDSDGWEPMSMQLDFQAMETLQHLGQPALDPLEEEQSPQASEPSELEGEMQEMQEVPRRSYLSLQIPTFTSRQHSITSTPISDLSIPSPGGFFSSLQPAARHTWSFPQKQPTMPNTSVAEKFYGLPWETKKNTASNRDSTLAGSTLDGSEYALPSPRVITPIEEGLEVKEINPSKTIFQYNESYNAELQKAATANLERTTHWIDEQDELQAALREMNNLGSPSSPKAAAAPTHGPSTSIDNIVRKKSVKFADNVADKPAKDEPKKIDTYVQGFEYLRQRSQKQDVFIHRQTRAEAMHVHRRCMSAEHRDQLLGKFELSDPVRPAPPRPVSEFYMNDPTVFKERIARAQAERQALDQMLPSTWVLQALKQLHGGRLLSKPAAKCVKRAHAPRILDVGGVAVNDWAWDIAFEHPSAAVTTVYTSGTNLTPDVAGPANHKCTTVPNMWTFPFPSGHFDVVSARSLYELLKTHTPLGRAQDEYDLCIRECYRVLKPGGVFDFSLLDADIMHAGRRAQALSVEFGFNLKTRGYEAQPTKTFLPRLQASGFRDVSRAWLVLPMNKTHTNWRDILPVGAQRERGISPEGDVQVGDAPAWGSTVDAGMLTGLAGSWMYERWLLKLQREMGREGERLLEGVVDVLEEGAGEGSAWRYLTGCARK